MLRSVLLRLSASRSLRAFAERSALGRTLSSRFVAGTTIAEALAAAEAINRRAMAASIDNLGENVTTAEEARRSAEIYHQLLDEIAARSLKANVSIKLTHMGLDLQRCLASQLLRELVAHAATNGNFIRVDMEGSAYTQATIELVEELHRAYPGRVGTVIQSSLRRSQADVERLLAAGIRIRLVKGAYQEPPEIAWQKKSAVDASYLRLMRLLLKSGIYHGIATHDERIIRRTIEFARAEGISPEAFEFQMLYGIRRDLQQKLVREGWNMRVYIPFGTEWYPYLMRRLAERPANLFFVLKNLLRR